MKRRAVVSAVFLLAVLAVGAGYWYWTDGRYPKLNPLWGEYFDRDVSEEAVPREYIQDIGQSDEQDGISLSVLQTVTYDRTIVLLLEAEFPDEALRDETTFPEITFYEGVPEEGDAGLEGERVHIGGTGNHTNHFPEDSHTAFYSMAFHSSSPNPVLSAGMTLSAAVEGFSRVGEEGEPDPVVLTEPMLFTWEIREAGATRTAEVDGEEISGIVRLNPFVLEVILPVSPYDTTDEFFRAVKLIDASGETEDLRGGSSGSLHNATMWLRPPADMQDVTGVAIGEEQFTL